MTSPYTEPEATIAHEVDARFLRCLVKLRHREVVYVSQRCREHHVCNSRQLATEDTAQLEYLVWFLPKSFEAPVNPMQSSVHDKDMRHVVNTWLCHRETKCNDGDILATKVLDMVKPPHRDEASRPHGLLCDLLPFQARALTWMMEREDEVAVNMNGKDTSSQSESVLHPLFQRIQLPHQSVLFYSKLTGELTQHRVPYLGSQCLGGMLCQVMGLGIYRLSNIEMFV